jgi:hypothetical protein
VAADIAQQGTSDKAITLTVTGTDSLEQGAVLSVQPELNTAVGTQVLGETHTWTAP